jgi:hypothetical protein
MAKSLVSDTEAYLSRPARAVLALSNGSIDEAVNLITLKKKDPDLREVRRLVSRKEQQAIILVAASQWQQAKDELDVIIPICEESNLPPALMPMLALSTEVERALTNDLIAQQKLEEAKLLHKGLSEFISDDDHRNAFLNGAVAQQLLLV